MTAAGISVVPMEQRHLDAVAGLEKACFSEPWSREGLAAELRNNTAHFFVAECGKEAAGYLGMYGVLGEGYITNIAVFPAYRRQGVGEALLDKALFYCESEGYAFISLEVRASNTAAIALYQKKGFMQMGVRRNFYRAPIEDGLILTRRFHVGEEESEG